MNALLADRPSHHWKLWVSCLNWSSEAFDQLSPATAIFVCSTTSAVGLLRTAEEQPTTFSESRKAWLSLPNYEHEGLVTGFDLLTPNFARHGDQKQFTHFTNYKQFSFF